MGRSTTTDSQFNMETSSGDESRSTKSELLQGTSLNRHGSWLSLLPSRISGLLAPLKAASTDASKVRYLVICPVFLMDTCKKKKKKKSCMKSFTSVKFKPLHLNDITTCPPMT